MIRVLVLSIPFAQSNNITDVIEEIIEFLNCSQRDVERLVEGEEVRLTFPVPVLISDEDRNQILEMAPGGIDVFKTN